MKGDVYGNHCCMQCLTKLEVKTKSATCGFPDVWANDRCKLVHVVKARHHVHDVQKRKNSVRCLASWLMSGS